MKNFCITIIFLSIIFMTVAVYLTVPKPTYEYLRIHVRANSNGEKDQEVKMEIKDIVVNYLTPYIADCESKNEAIVLLNDKKDDIERLIDKHLNSRGFNYVSKVKIDSEEFPLRVYEGVTLQEGYYDAVIVNLGKAEGDNWWCVVYPPLCFYGNETDIKYKSKLKEIIDSFFS